MEAGERSGPDDYSDHGESTKPTGSPSSRTGHSGGSSSTDVAARIMAETLSHYGYHPVILCGTTAAGKTTALASLCSFFKRRGGAIRFGPWPTDGGSSEDAARLQQAKQFYYSVVDDFGKGIAPESTGTRLPYVVPLELTPTVDSAVRNNGSEKTVAPTRIAVIDMGGELFKPRELTDRSSHQLSDVQALLQLYTKPVSMLYLAPFTRLDGYSRERETRSEPYFSPDATERLREHPDAALANALSAYDSARPSKTVDRHLFLFTKWDLAVGGIDSAEFLDPDREDVSARLQALCPNAWGAFASMRAAVGAKCFTQYCAGVIAGSTVVTYEPGSSQELALDLYSKVLWNWIYRGATRDDQCPEGLLLFPEVVPALSKGLLASFFGARAK